MSFIFYYLHWKIKLSTKIELGLVGGTISMITGLTLLDIIEAMVVIAGLIFAQHKIRTMISGTDCKHALENWVKKLHQCFLIISVN